jgi:hypothetical protein
MTEAIEIADCYNWAPEMPDAVKQMRQGTIPEGFGRLVGQTIALFLERPVIGQWMPAPYLDGDAALAAARQKAEEDEQNNRQHARRLARLRFLIAEINIARRKGQDHE